MSDETGDSSRREKALLAVVPALAGVVAGFVSFVAAASATDTLGVIVLGGFAVTSIGIGRLSTSKDFGGKDYLFMGFLTFFAWFVVWGSLMSI